METVGRPNWREHWVFSSRILRRWSQAKRRSPGPYGTKSFHVSSRPKLTSSPKFVRNSLSGEAVDGAKGHLPATAPSPRDQKTALTQNGAGSEEFVVPWDGVSSAPEHFCSMDRSGVDHHSWSVGTTEVVQQTQKTLGPLGPVRPHRQSPEDAWSSGPLKGGPTRQKNSWSLWTTAA
jgi:hypothetical protein